jgi:hypothetical protein
MEKKSGKTIFPFRDRTRAEKMLKNCFFCCCSIHFIHPHDIHTMNRTLYTLFEALESIFWDMNKNGLDRHFRVMGFRRRVTSQSAMLGFFSPPYLLSRLGFSGCVSICGNCVCACKFLCSQKTGTIYHTMSFGMCGTHNLKVEQSDRAKVLQEVVSPLHPNDIRTANREKNAKNDKCAFWLGPVTQKSGVSIPNVYAATALK